MTDQTPVASIPVAWLKPLPEGYKIPAWRWIVIPATTIMLKRRGGAWVSGTLELHADSIRFVQTKLNKSSRGPLDSWMLALSGIANINMKKGLASDGIEIAHAGRITKLMAVRSGEFVDLLQQALPRR